MIPQPVLGVSGAAQIQNLGIHVNLGIELNLKLLSFYLRHQAHDHTAAVANVALESICS